MAKRKSAADELAAAVPGTTGPLPWYKREEYAAIMPELNEIRERWHEDHNGGKTKSYVWAWCVDRYDAKLPKGFVGKHGFEKWLTSK